ncbi:MAG: four helix bundle protein [bacterium]
MEKIKSFTDLNTWKEGHSLALSVYEITKSFPKEEIFSLTNQMRRCAVSITSNIAEGFSRRSKKEKIQFYSISLGSITELQNQLIISKDIKYLMQEKFTTMFDQATKTQRMIYGLIKSAKDVVYT